MPSTSKMNQWEQQSGSILDLKNDIIDVEEAESKPALQKAPDSPDPWNQWITQGLPPQKKQMMKNEMIAALESNELIDEEMRMKPMITRDRPSFASPRGPINMPRNPIDEPYFSPEIRAPRPDYFGPPRGRSSQFRTGRPAPVPPMNCRRRVPSRRRPSRGIPYHRPERLPVSARSFPPECQEPFLIRPAVTSRGI